MLALLAQYQVRPEAFDDVGSALREMAAEVERAEPGCLFYSASRSTERQHTFVLYEVYIDEAALLAHRETRHFQRIIEGFVVPRLDAREREILEVVAVSTSHVEDDTR